MRKLIFPALVVLFVMATAFQCNRGLDCCVMPPCSESPTLAGTWRLDFYENPTTGKSEPDPDPKGKGVVYTFSDDEKSGSIEGHTVVNTVLGTYELGTECSFRVLTFGGSKVGEPEWSGKAWLPAEKSGYYQRTGNKLIIYFNGNEERLVFKKM